MNKIGHILFATLMFTFIYVAISNIIEIDVSKVLIAFFIFLIYTLLPDIDKNNSWIRKQLDKIIFFFIFFFIIISLVYSNITASIIAGILVLVELFLTLVKHRGPLHSVSFGILIASPLLFIDSFYFFAGLFGVIVHLIADYI